MPDDKMQKFVFDIIGSEEGMKQKMVANFKALSDRKNVSEEDIRRFVKIVFDHSLSTSGNQRLKDSLDEYLDEVAKEAAK